MIYVNFRVKALVLLAASLLATFAIAQSPASNSDNQNSSQQTDQQTNSGQQNDQQTQQADQQNQNQTSAANNSNGNTQQGANQAAQSADNSQQQTNRDRSQIPAPNQQQPARDSSTDRNSSTRSHQQDQRGSADTGSHSSAQDRQGSTQDQRNAANFKYDNRNRDRSGQVDQRNIDGRTRTDQSLSRDQSTSRRADMRAPDMGLWFNRSSRDGLVIADVAPRGAIAKFGFREGDRIVSVNGRRVSSEAEFMDLVFHSNGERVNVVIFRDGREQTIVVEPAVFTNEYEHAEVNPLERFGIILDDRYDDRIVVWRIIPRSPAYYAGFRPGDVIATFSGRPYRTRTEFETSVGTWNPGEANVQVRRGDRVRELSVDVPVFDRSMERSARRGERIEQRQSIRNDNPPPNNRPGILNGGLRSRGNR